MLGSSGQAAGAHVHSREGRGLEACAPGIGSGTEQGTIGAGC